MSTTAEYVLALSGAVGLVVAVGWVVAEGVA